MVWVLGTGSRTSSYPGEMVIEPQRVALDEDAVLAGVHIPSQIRERFRPLPAQAAHRCRYGATSAFSERLPRVGGSVPRGRQINNSVRRSDQPRHVQRKAPVKQAVVGDVLE